MKHIRPRIQAVIFNADHKLLLALHQKKDSYYVLPGGGLEYGEKFEEGMLRELHEELDITDANVKQLLFADEFIDENRHVIHLSFLVTVPEETLRNLTVVIKNESIKEIGFFSSKDIIHSPNTFYPSKDLLIKLINGNSY